MSCIFVFPVESRKIATASFSSAPGWLASLLGAGDWGLPGVLFPFAFAGILLTPGQQEIGSQTLMGPCWDHVDFFLHFPLTSLGRQLEVA